MKLAVLWVYTAALVMQLGGVYFVISDVVRNKSNVDAFTTEWAKLDGRHNPNNWPHFKEAVVANWIKSEHMVSDLRRFAPIVVLLLGVVVGFIGNMLALYA